MDRIRARQLELEQELHRMQAGQSAYDRLEQIANERDAEIFAIYQKYQEMEEQAFVELRMLGCDVPDNKLLLNELDFDNGGEVPVFSFSDGPDFLQSAHLGTPPATPTSSTKPKRARKSVAGKPAVKPVARTKKAQRSQALEKYKIGDHLANVGTIIKDTSGWVEIRCSHCGGNESAASKRYVLGLTGMKSHLTLIHGAKQTNEEILQSCQVCTLTDMEAETLRTSSRYDPIPRIPMKRSSTR